jgi:hypothetical protein
MSLCRPTLKRLDGREVPPGAAGQDSEYRSGDKEQQ